MGNRMLFDTADYLGIDLDQERLDANQARYPGVRTLCAEIESAAANADLRGDVVLCVQVMHTRFFATERTVPTIAAMCQMLRPGGMLIFNFGERNMPFEGEVDALLGRKFDRVKKRPYGAFSANETNLPVNAQYIVAPRLNTSVARVIGLRLTCSGAI